MMQPQQHEPLTWRRQAFTLVELLTVLAIIGIISGIVIGSYHITSDVDAAGRLVSKQLYLARQYAVSQRCYVAVLLPDDSITGTGKDFYKQSHFNRALRVVKVTSARLYAGQIAGSEWTMLPGRAEILDKTGTALVTVDRDANYRDATNALKPNIEFVSGAGEFGDFPALVFTPSGSLDGTGDVIIRIHKPNTDIARTVTLTVNWLTGRTQFQKN
jgi:prepilin-type N-terminal cleavage/methylation domain-containing protein